VVTSLSIVRNAILGSHKNPPLARGLFLNENEINKWAEELIAKYNIVAPNKDTLVGNLSGGNIQRLILARELCKNPKIIIANQPTMGLDISATQYVHEKLIEQKLKGTAILLISGDLDELLALSDRIAVIYEGKFMGVVATEKADVKSIGLMMGGVEVNCRGENLNDSEVLIK
jgi:simple sugar transport system ATP-binding protein